MLIRDTLTLKSTDISQLPAYNGAQPWKRKISPLQTILYEKKFSNTDPIRY
jgi:hypothetical protein